MVRFVPLLLVALSATAFAAEPRQPRGKWVVDFADKMCVLQREYGTPADPLTFALRTDPMSDHVRIMIFDRPSPQNAANFPVTIGFGPGSDPVEGWMETFDLRSRGFRLSMTILKNPNLERAKVSNVMSFDAQKRLSVTFQLPNFSSALKILDECVADLLATWGFTREMQAAMATKPEPLKPLQQYVTIEDYPKEALRAEESGSNSARFWIGTDGRTSDCTVVESSGSRSLDSTLCRVVQRYQYKPALDRAQQPMPSIGFARLTWRVSPFH